MPLFKFSSFGGFEDGIFDSIGPKRLKYQKCTNFDLRCYECNTYEYNGMHVCGAIMNATMINICRLRDKTDNDCWGGKNVNYL
jgi:hypothetical protein